MAVNTYYNSMYPVNIKPYNPQRNKKPVGAVNDDPQSKNGSNQSTDNEGTGSSKSYELKSSVNSGNVNISQITNDFRNTLTAIGAPKEIEEEVSGYLSLVDIQSQKGTPSTNIIKANLKNASTILDDYITKTLGRPSKVVSNWVDVVLLQNVDYKTTPKTSNSTPIEPQIPSQQTVNIPPEQAQTIPPQTTEDYISSQPVQVDTTTFTASPESIKLQNLYNKCGKLTDSGDYDKALDGYNKALALAQNLGDHPTQAQIHMDMAFIHDVNNNYPQALDNYNNAATLAAQSNDMITQAQAHYNMATIYDDFGKTDIALDHYHTALSFDGATENIKGQTLTLNSIGNVYSSQADYKTSLDYYKVGYGLATDQNDKEGQAAILSNTANVFNELGNNKKALKLYGNSAKFDMAAGNASGVAKSYEQAGDIMIKNGLTDKAAALYQKSMSVSQQIGDSAWTSRLTDKLNSLS